MLAREVATMHTSTTVTIVHRATSAIPLETSVQGTVPCQSAIASLDKCPCPIPNATVAMTALATKSVHVRNQVRVVDAENSG